MLVGDDTKLGRMLGGQLGENIDLGLTAIELHSSFTEAELGGILSAGSESGDRFLFTCILYTGSAGDEPSEEGGEDGSTLGGSGRVSGGGFVFEESDSGEFRNSSPSEPRPVKPPQMAPGKFQSGKNPSP